MKKIVLLLLLIFPHCVFALDGDDDNILRDYYVQLYRSKQYTPDFGRKFSSSADKQDYKKLREYLNNKEEICRILRMAADEYYYGLSFSKLYATDYIQGLQDEVLSRNRKDNISLRINSVRPSFNYNGNFRVSYIESIILPAIKLRFQEEERRDSINQVSYMQIQQNIEAIRQDIFQAEQAIHQSLSPETRDQDFRMWVSFTFSGLIAILLFSFFWIIYKRSDRSLSKAMLTDSGLQFITVFILIIAIILFGILDVIGGSELAAILAGISGYILGKGGQGGTNSGQVFEKPLSFQEMPGDDTRKDITSG
ncbi:hypothetical protein [Dysgonomonas capnocytophagoides]|uniref:hypothetical protein n=1 Tax=Dysgonomonas capnocytophagoides TaxID=45254 RepID=UPI00333F3EBE